MDGSINLITYANTTEFSEDVSRIPSQSSPKNLTHPVFGMSHKIMPTDYNPPEKLHFTFDI